MTRLELRAVDMPEPLAERLRALGREPSAPPDVVPSRQLAARWAGVPVEVAGTGFNGVVLAGAAGAALKIHNEVFQEPGARHRWRALVEAAPLEGFVSPHWALTQPELVRTYTSALEIWGARLLRAYGVPVADATAISDDLLCYERSFVSGVPFVEALRDGRHDRLHLWRTLIALQRVVERMLVELGVTVDLLNAGNLVVDAAAQLWCVDPELVAPDAATRRVYEDRGQPIPHAPLPAALRLVEWPLMPEQIVQNGNWGLEYEETLEYIAVLHGASTRADAIAALAEVPAWTNHVVPRAEDHRHLRRARAENARQVTA